MPRRQAFTFIETLLALVICMMIITSFQVLLQGLLKMALPKSNSDLTQAIVSITEEVNMAKQVKVEDECLRLVYSSKESTYFLDNHRLVKTPGFNIYLHNIDELFFEDDGIYVYMYLKRGDNDGWFNIGTSYRPKKGLCQPNRVDGDDDISDDDCSIDSDHLNEP